MLRMTKEYIAHNIKQLKIIVKDIKSETIKNIFSILFFLFSKNLSTSQNPLGIC